MSPISSTLPHSAHTAAQNALQAALNDPSSQPPSGTTKKARGMSSTPPVGDDVEGVEVEVEEGTVQEIDVRESEEGGMETSESSRTVFDDPMTFNVKHPLYTAWTLWFDSPQTKGKMTGTPSTPMSAVPPTPMSAQAASWMDDIKKVIEFDSVEEFWGLYNNIVPPSQLPQKANYYLFKENIIPAWEDDANKFGGKWSIQLPRDKNRNSIDKMWLYTMLAAIGETFDPVFSKAASEHSTLPPSPSSQKTLPPQSLITGVIVSTRPQFFRLSIWTRLAPGMAAPASDLPSHPSEEGDALRERIEAIGKYFKTAVLGYAEGQKLGGPLATEVEFVSHKDSEKKGRQQKKWIV